MECSCITTIVSIFLSVVSIVIAICSSRQTSKDAAKQIGAIKDLCALQIDASIKYLAVELKKAQLKVKQGKAEKEYLDEAYNGSMSFFGPMREESLKHFPAYKSKMDYQFFSDYEKQLKNIQSSLEELKQKIQK